MNPEDRIEMIDIDDRIRNIESRLLQYTTPTPDIKIELLELYLRRMDLIENNRLLIDNKFKKIKKELKVFRKTIFEKQKEDLYKVLNGRWED